MVLADEAIGVKIYHPAHFFTSLVDLLLQRGQLLLIFAQILFGIFKPLGNLLRGPIKLVQFDTHLFLKRLH